MATAQREASNESQSEHKAFDRHRGPVTCVAGIPGQDAAISSGYDSAVGLVDLQAESIELLGYHNHLVNKVVVNPEGTIAATCSSDYTACLWDLESRKPVRVLRGHWDDVEDFAFIDPSTGVSVSRDRRILVWNLETGAIDQVIEGHHRDVLSVDYLNGSIFTSGDDMTLRQWDLASGQQQHCWGPFEVETDTCAVDPSHGRIILGADDGSIRVFDIETGQSIKTIMAHRSGIKKVAVSPVTGDILSAAYDQRILIWDAQTLELTGELQSRPGTWERSLNWTADGRNVLAGTFDGTIRVWSGASGVCKSEIGTAGDRAGNACLNDVYSDPSGNCALVADDGIVRLARPSPAEPGWLATAEPSNGRVLMNAVCLSRVPGNQSLTRIWCGAHDHQLHVFDFEDNAVKTHVSLPLDAGPINCIRVQNKGADSLSAWAACYSGNMVRVDLEAGQEMVIGDRFAIHDGAVKAVRLRPGREEAASGAADGSLVTWQLDGTIQHELAGHTAIVDDVDFDPSGEFLASVSRDFTLNVYHVDSGRLVHSILLGRESPKCVLFWDADTVFVGNYWGFIWRVTLHDEKITSHPVAINGISSFSRSTDGLLASAYDGSLTLLNPESLNVISRLRCLEQKLPGFEKSASFD
ncbi:MAG TPA: WD40 repeat domain-containing protein [Xanthomonadales bacterium]|nr:WD40 repeat domain-containing protein [Xanthomonadales bacterium]